MLNAAQRHYVPEKPLIITILIASVFFKPLQNLVLEMWRLGGLCRLVRLGEIQALGRNGMAGRIP